MAREISPLKVGTFVLLALFLALGMLLFFSTTTLFSSTQTYILYFEDSVKGLSVGSSVRFKGVPIGQVKKIYLSYNQPKTSARIPVLVEIEGEQLNQLAALRKVPVDSVLQREVEGGMRAQLQLESFITGLLFIDLNYFPNAGAPEYLEQNTAYREIPTIRSGLNELGNSANDLVARLNSVDYAGLADSIRNLANSLNRVVGSVDGQKFAVALQGSMESLHSILNSANEEHLGQNSAEALKSIRQTADRLGALSEEVRGALRGENSAGSRLYHLAENVSDAAEAFSRLADYIERNPNAFLTGKTSGQTQDSNE